MNPITVILLLLLASSLLCIFETLMPTMGVATLAAIACSVIGCINAFRLGPLWGLLAILANGMAIVISFNMAFDLILIPRWKSTNFTGPNAKARRQVS